MLVEVDVDVLVDVLVEVDVDVDVLVEVEVEVDVDVDVDDVDVCGVDVLVVNACATSQLQYCFDVISTGAFPRGDAMNCAKFGPGHVTPCKVT